MKKIKRLILLFIIILIFFPWVITGITKFLNNIDFHVPQQLSNLTNWGQDKIVKVGQDALNNGKNALDRLSTEASKNIPDFKFDNSGKILEVNDVKVENLKSPDEVIRETKIGKAENVPYSREEYDKPNKRIEGKSIRDWVALNSAQWLINEKDFKYICPYGGLEVGGSKAGRDKEGYFTDIRKLDWEHIIPLAYANSHGAYHWSKEKKNAFAFDPNIGVATSARENRIKGAKGPSEYMPKYNQASYCYTFLTIANKYNLTVDQKDFDVCVKAIEADKENAKPINVYKDR